MALIRWRPFHNLEDLFFEKPFNGKALDLAVDVYEENNNIIVKMNIPGIDGDKIKIDIEKDHL